MPTKPTRNTTSTRPTKPTRKTSSAGPSRPGPRRRVREHRLRRALWVSTTAVMVIAVLFVFVFPTGTYLNQRSHLMRVSSAVASLDAKNKALANEVARLNTETAIERLARQDYGLVPPGQEAYAMLPSGSGSTSGRTNPALGIVHPEVPLGVEPQATAGSPTAKVAPSHRGFFGRILHRLVAWL